MAALGDELGNYGFAIDISSKLIELVGPNGEDLFKDPLLLTAKIVQEQAQLATATAQAIAAGMEKVDTTSPEVIQRYVDERMEAREAALANPGNSLNPFSAGRIEGSKTWETIIQSLTGTGITQGDLVEFGTKAPKDVSEEDTAIVEERLGVSLATVQAALADPLGEAATELLRASLAANAATDQTIQGNLRYLAEQINAENIGKQMGLVENYFNALQGGLATVTATADENLAAARESGDPEQIAAALEARDKALSDYAEANRQNTLDLEAALLGSEDDVRSGSFQDQNKRITEGLEGDAKIAMEAILPQLSGISDQEYLTNIKLRGLLEQGDISPNELLDIVEGKEPEDIRATYDLIANLSVNIGEDYATKAVELANDIEGVVNAQGIDISGQVADSFLNGLASVTPAEAMDNVQAFGDLSRWREIFPNNFGEIIQDFASPESLAAFQEKQQGLSGIDFTDDAALSEAMTGPGKQALQEYIAAEGEAWDALDQTSKEDFATILDVTIGYSGESWLVDLLKSQQEGDDTENVTFGKLIEQRLPSRTEVPPPGTETPKPTPTGSGAEPQIDSLLKKLRDLRRATIDMKKGWEGMQEVLADLFAGGTKSIDVFDGLSNQIREFDVGENLIEMIVGMDPDEYEKRKNELFTFDKAGNITGITAKLKNMNAALGAIALGEYVNTQQAFIENTRNQITAISTLTANGLSLSEAYQVVQDEAVAAKIAMGATTEEIKELVRITQIANGLREDLEEQNERSQISEAVRKTNEEFENRVAVLDRLSKSAGQYTDAQITALLDDTNLQKLMLDPSIDQGALNQALRNAERNAEIELKVKLATTEGTKGVFEEGFAQAMDAFSRQEQEIELNFRAANADDTALVEDAQNRIADIQYELDDYNAELERISWQEESINDKYDKRFEALESIAEVNERISREQEAQLDIADALSRGDIAGAARAQQELRSKQAQDAAKQQRDMLEQARDAEVAALTSGGMTREQLEDRIQGLERQIFAIEESDLEPAQERLRLQEIIKQDQIESLVVLEKTRDEWDRIKNNIDIAEASGYKFKETMQQALDVVEKLMEAYPEIKPAPPPPPPPPAPSGGGRGGPDLGQPGKGAWKIGNQTLSEIAQAANFGSWQEYYNANRGSQNLDAKLRPAASGGLMKMAMGGKVKRYAGGGMIIPKRMAMGGMSMGSDIIPAILTPGEFVVRRPAVSAFGADNLEKINRGTYSDGTVYNYNLAVNVKSDSDPNRIARAVMTQIKGIENQRIRSNRL